MFNPIIPLVVPFPEIGISLLVAVIYGVMMWLIMKRTPGYVKTAKLNKWAVGIACGISFLVLIRFGTVMQSIKGLLYLAVLIHASVCDIKTRRVTDWASLCIFLIGFIDVTKNELLYNSLTSVLTFGFMLLCAVISKNRIGGADIKLITASMLVLGFDRGVIGLAAGLLLGTVTTFIMSKTKKNIKADKVTIPLIPYLSIGFMGGYFI